MVNLRVVKLSIKNSTTIEVLFTHSLNLNIGTSNVAITSISGSVSNPTISSVVPSEKVLTITTRPLAPRANYRLELSSTTSQSFIGNRGENLVEDGSNNIVFFIGQSEDNIVRDSIIGDLPDIYVAESGDLVYDTIDAGAKQVLDSSHAAGEVRSANYISIEITDAELVRGSGPFDRFEDEGVFQLLRVGSSPTSAEEQNTISFTEFPSDPVSLKQVFVDTEVISNSSNDANSFSGLLITLSKKIVIKVTSIILVRNSQEFTYDLSQYKYGVNESKYDSTNSYPAVDIEKDQIRLNDSAIGTFPLPQGSDTLKVSYYYKKEGRDISSDSIEISTVVDVTRESVSAVATTFTLRNAPIVNSSGVVPTTGGITWLDPTQNYDSTKKHPAFITEVVFSESSLPNAIGNYSVNYNTGQVFVYGADGSGVDGSTTVPPVATYKYKKTYQSGLDYIFFSDLDEIASIPSRDLRGNPANVVFNFEDAFADGTDFQFASHVEVINERVENQLIETIGLKTQKYPVNEVFRIYNETTGEIYTPTRVSGNEVYFTSIQPPRTSDISREVAIFESSIQSQLVVTNTTQGSSFNIFKIELEDSKIVSSYGGFIGASFNSSLTFSDTTLFAREFYYSPDKTLDQNLQRLSQVGDYIVNYDTGIVYLAVVSGQNTDIGDATYKKNNVQTRNPRIIRVDDIYRSSSVSLSNTETLRVGTISSTTVDIPNISNVGETQITDNSGSSTEIVVSSNDSIIVSSDVFRLYHIFQVTDLQTTSSPINFATGAQVSSSSGSTIQLDSYGVTVSDDNSGNGILVKAAGSREYITPPRISDFLSQGLAELVSAVSITPLDSNFNYFTQGTDGYVDSVNNRIYLPSGFGITGSLVASEYKVKLRGGAAVLVDYVNGDMFIDYTYSQDEILISYEYGDNVLDWSISSVLNEGDTYYATYKYGALRNSLRDNFGILTSLSELATIPDDLSRETYRDAVSGSLQSFLKGPTIPSIKALVEAFTQIDPNIVESVFQEWILGRDYLYLLPMKLDADSEEDLPTYSPGKFGNGLLLDKSTQVAVIPATSNIRFGEGTWEAFITPNWSGIENDANLTFDISLDNIYRLDKIFIGSNATQPIKIPFSLNKDSPEVLGRPSNLHGLGVSGYFIWYDAESKRWRLRTRAPISEERLFSGSVTTSGEFYNVKIASTADGYDGYDGYEVNEVNDYLWSTNEDITFSFKVDGYDILNLDFDAYDAYDSIGSIAGFDGIDFTSDNLHYLFDTGVEINKNRMSLYKDGDGFLKFRIHDDNGRMRVLSHDISEWLAGETHHVATSWKIGTIEQRDELHLFVDGEESVNAYRFRGYLDTPSGSLFLDRASEVILSSATVPTIGGTDLSTTAGSNRVISSGSNFSGNGMTIGNRFEILDDTDDGLSTQVSPFVYISNVVGQNILELEVGPASSGVPWNASATLSGIRFSANPLQLETVSDPQIEKIKVFSVDSYGTESEMQSPDSSSPDYGFSRDGYIDYINVYNGISIGDSIEVKSYGLIISRAIQYAYIWPDLETNLLSTITPAPTSVSKINITNLILRRTVVEPGVFALVATSVGGHLISIFAGSLDFCQPSNTVTGRRMTATVSGDNIDWSGLNRVIFIGTTTDGYNVETLSFTSSGKQTTSRYFTSLTDIHASFTPIDSTVSAGSIEIREASPLNWSENSGLYADIHLSVQEQAGTNGVTDGTNRLTDAYARFGAEDVGKTVNITSPSAIVDVYTITDVPLDSSGKVKDSNIVVLDSIISANTNINWQMINTSYGNNGFANGLITLETSGTGGSPFLLRSCWYEVDFPAYLVLPWNCPDDLYIGSDIEGNNQADAVIDELRVLDEISLDTGTGESLPSSGRSITTDAQIVQEFTATDQTLMLFHFNDSITNSANFMTSFSGSYRQSENSVNSSFGQSGVFNTKNALKADNKSIFRNNEGTIEFWVSPILSTYNDPTLRYYIDLSPELTMTASVLTSLSLILPARARSISSITIVGDETNYFIGGSLASDGITVTLGQSLPSNTSEVNVTYVPITSQGDRFSIYKNETGFLVLVVTASEVDYQISVPIYWEKNTWHRIFAGWDLNNSDNQDRLILMVDGAEAGTIRYGTGLYYGTGVKYGQKTIWGSATAGTTVSRNILADINLIDTFNTINIGADFTEQFTALARMDNIRFSSQLRPITYLGATSFDVVESEGPGRLIGQDLLFTSNTNTAQPVISDALTRLLLDFDTSELEVEYLAMIRDAATGIFDFFLEVIDTFELVDTSLTHQLITNLVNKIRPSHTRAFVSFTK
jgi:hypothetical protein